MESRDFGMTEMQNFGMATWQIQFTLTLSYGVYVGRGGGAGEEDGCGG